MSEQVAVRLPDELVSFVDGVVADGDAPSRAFVITRALERERRRAVAARDAEILARAEPDTDMDALADHASSIEIDLA